MANKVRGPIAWMANHGIAPNLLMLLLICGGLIMSVVIRKEYLPEATVGTVNISVKFPGATPAEMESVVILPLEAALRGVDNIKEVYSVARQGRATLRVYLRTGANGQKAYQDIQQVVSRINTFPSGMESPHVALASFVSDVMEIVVHADLDAIAVKRLAEKVRDRILQSPYISQIDLRGFAKEEVHIEVSQLALQRYNLSLDKVAAAVKKHAMQQSAGSVKTDAGDILVTVDQRRFWAHEFGQIPVLSGEQGSLLRLRDIASVTEGFADERALIHYNGQLSGSLRIYRVGDQTPEAIGGAVKKLWPELQAMLPPGAGLSIVDDDAQSYSERLNLLLKNAFFGLLLVLILMSLFLEYRLAFWVVVGIPSAFLGTLLFLPVLGISINMVSMFGFIIALGIVVDDAIIAGENIYVHIQRGDSRLDAAIAGAREVAMPLTFAILTNIVAFLPLLLLPGKLHLMFGAIPVVVILCFLISWVEALFILPAHLARIKDEQPSRLTLYMAGIQKNCEQALYRFMHTAYKPLLQRCLNWPAMTLALALLVLTLVFSHALSGRMGFSLMPKMEGQWAKASMELPEDMTMAEVLKIRDELQLAAQRTLKKHQLESVLLSIRSVIIDTNMEVGLLLVPSEQREIDANTLVSLWREEAKKLRQLGKLRFGSGLKGSSSMGDAAITLELRHVDTDSLQQAMLEVEDFLASTAGVVGAANTMSNGKQEWQLELNENGRSLGIDPGDLAKQVRNALYGARVLRQQRGKNQMTVLVRLPVEERSSVSDINRLLLRTATAGYVPLAEIADIRKTHAAARIVRSDGQRIERIGIEVDAGELVPGIVDELDALLIPELLGRFPGLEVNYRGQRKEIQESVSILQVGTVFALLLIYILLAIPFKSYSQPLLVMAIIPFGAVGAILGHMLLGVGLSVVSLQGMLALCGIVVNDSLILIETCNRIRRSGLTAMEAIIAACEHRFRPIVLTTMTTFGGVAPMIFEGSHQAQFMVPMVVSLGFGILLTTLVCLLVLPCLYLLLETRQRVKNEQYAAISDAENSSGWVAKN